MVPGSGVNFVPPNDGLKQADYVGAAAGKPLLNVADRDAFLREPFWVGGAQSSLRVDVTEGVSCDDREQHLVSRGGDDVPIPGRVRRAAWHNAT